jgi:hypothetical protein
MNLAFYFCTKDKVNKKKRLTSQSDLVIGLVNCEGIFDDIKS